MLYFKCQYMCICMHFAKDISMSDSLKPADLYTPISPKVSWSVQGNGEWKQKDEDGSPSDFITILQQDYFKWLCGLLSLICSSIPPLKLKTQLRVSSSFFGLLLLNSLVLAKTCSKGFNLHIIVFKKPYQKFWVPFCAVVK